MPKTVHDFEAPTPFNYPGERHEGNFLLLDGETILDVSAHPDVALKEIDKILRERRLPLIEDRVPMLAFGANASPGRVAPKTDKFSYGTIGSDDLGTVPMLRASLSGHDIVWHGRPGQKGGYFSELISTPENPDATVDVWVQFLTTEQLASIHTSEGMTYEISEVPGASLGDGMTIDTIGYTAREASMLLDENANPISVKGIDRLGHDTKEMDAREALEYTLGQEAVVSLLGVRYTPEAFFEAGEAMKLSERKSRQARIHETLAGLSLSKHFRYDTAAPRFSRADFDSLPRGIDGGYQSTTVHLMEQHIAGIRPSHSAVAEKQAALRDKFPDDSDERIAERVRNLLDPAQNIRTKAHDELIDPNRERRLAEWKIQFDEHHSNHTDINL